MKYTTIVSVLLLLLNVCKSQTIAQIASNTDFLSTLVGALTTNNLVSMFDSTDMNYTVFAPTNDAFMNAGFKMDGSNVDAQILTAHVVSGIAMSTDLMINGVYPTLAMNNMNQTYNLTYTASLTFTDGSGSMVMVNASFIDIIADNGVVHVIDQVIFPGNIINFLLDTQMYSFDTLAAVATPTVANALSTLGNGITLFAPIDTAFTAIDQSILALLTAQENMNKLEQLLLYHAATGVVMAEDVVSGSPFEVTSMNTKNSKFTITVGNPDITIQDKLLMRNPSCKIIGTDYRRGNGVVHVIDCVITDETIVDVIAEEGLTELATAATTANLINTLSSQGTYTVFGPDNNAFNAAAAITSTLDQATLANVLLYHVIPAVVPEAAALTLDNAIVTTALMMNITVDGNGVDTVTITDGIRNMRTVTMTDKFALNGIVHIINGVLIPITTVANTLLAKQTTSTLGGVIIIGGLQSYFDGSNGGITVLAPNNDAVDSNLTTTLGTIPGRISTDILIYHATPGKVLSTQLPMSGQMITMNNGKKVTVDKMNGVKFIGIKSNATVTEADIMCTDGIIHVIDNVLLPFDISNLMSITATAVATQTLSTLVTALQTAGLDTTLGMPNALIGYTVFAPPNTAFDMLPSGVLTSLLADTSALTNVLLGHVINGTYLASDVIMMNGMNITTLAGTKLTIMFDGQMVNLYDEAMNMYTITATDILCDNGVVHLINKVIADVYDTTTTPAPAPTDGINTLSHSIYIAMVILFFIFYY